MKIIALILFFICCTAVQAQEVSFFTQSSLAGSDGASNPIPKLRQRNYGAIIGLQKGRNTAFEMGGEMHWRKIGLKKPNIWGATANLEYHFSNNILGYKAGVWRKQGRVNLTYGANVAYFTDFHGGQQFGVGPMVGFRLLGLHLINGVNILAGDMVREKNGAPVAANTLYMSLRYYFPLQNKFVWDKKGKKEKKESGFLGLKGRNDKDDRKKEKDKKEQKGLRKWLNL